MKRNISFIAVIEWFIYILIFGFIIYSKLRSLESYEAFYEIVKEDGWAEYLTTLFLLFSALVFGYKAYQAARLKDTLKAIFYFIAFAVFIFGMGEEISWGQRIFGIESSDYFLENNYQKETNFHNLTVWGIDLNRVVFSKLMFIVLVFYFVLLMPLAFKVGKIRNLIIRFGLPLPRILQTILLIVSNVLVTTIDMVKESELHELALTGILFVVLLNPLKSFKGISFTGTAKR